MTILLWQRIPYPDINGTIYYLNKPVLEDMRKVLMVFWRPFTIRNQFTTSLSTLQATTEMREELLAYQRDFYKNAKKER
jgi:hypothetical protein